VDNYNATVVRIRRTLHGINDALPAALGWQWTAAPNPAPGGEGPRGDDGTYSNPTERVALDPARLELRAAITDVRTELEVSAAALEGSLARLLDALKPYGGA
jgi:hypothetical protein